MNRELLESVKIVFLEELDSALGQCRKLIDQDSDQDITELQEKFAVLKNSFSMLSISGAQALAFELHDTLLSFNEIKIKHPEVTSKVVSASNKLKDYFLLVSEGGLDCSLILADDINELRSLKGKPPLGEGALLNPFLQEQTIVTSAAPRTEEQLKVLSRAKQLYQKGLLYVIRNQNPRAALRIMLHSVSLLSRTITTDAEQKFWQLAATVFGAMAVGRLSINKMRIRVLMGLERQMANLGKAEMNDVALCYPLAVQRGLLACLMLTSRANPRERRLAESLKIDLDVISDQEIKTCREQFQAEHSASFQDNLVHLEDGLKDLRLFLDDSNAEGVKTANEIGLIRTQLEKIESLCSVLGLEQAKNNFTRHIEALESHNHSDLSYLHSMADSILHLECVLLQIGGRFPGESKLKQIDQAPQSALIEKNISIHAEKQALHEAVNALSDIMLTISDYFAGTEDELARNKPVEKFEVISGVTRMLQLDRATNVVEQCKALFLSSSHSDMDSRDILMDNLADAMASLEFYLTNRSYYQQADEDVLAIAEECLASTT